MMKPGVVEENNVVDQINMPNVPNEKPKVQDNNLDEDEEAAFNNLMAEMQ